MPLNSESKLRKGIYILPNIFTLGALFGGFLAILSAVDGKYELASLSIFASLVLDSLDGRVARMTKTQSAFGEQMDSLSDMVSFGVAPAVISYLWSLHTLGRWGWFSAFLYCSCTALRLARFNVNTMVVNKRYFQGLPSPAAAAIFAGLLLNYYGTPDSDMVILSWITFAIMVATSLSMVSNLPYYSFKELSFPISVPFTYPILIVIGLALVNIHPPLIIWSIFLIYGASGYFIYIYRKIKRLPVSMVSTSKDEIDERGLH